MTALIYTAKHGYADNIRFLLESEATMKDHQMKTAMMHAAQQGHTGVVRMLI